MSLSINDLIDLNKIPIKIFWFFGIVTGILLFSPQEFLKQLKLDKFEDAYGMYFGVIFIACISFIILSFIYLVINKIRNNSFRKTQYKSIKEELKNLDYAEKAVLREFKLSGRSTISMPFDNPTVAGLLGKNLLIIQSKISSVGTYFPMKINSICNRILTNSDINLPNTMNKIEEEELINNRPDFTTDRFYGSANE